MIQYQYLPGCIGAALMLCLLLGMLFAYASRIGVQQTINKKWNRSCVVFVVFALIATMYGGGKTNAVYEASSPGVTSVMRGATVLSPPPVSSGTNELAVLPPLEISSVCLDEYSFGGTFTWRGQDGAPSETTMDIFAAWPTLTNRWRWVGSAEVLGPVVSQQWSIATYQLGVDRMPGGLFVKFKERTSSAATMEDWDGDLLPGVYEVWNRTNPYVPDFENAPKLMVGSRGQYSSLMGALAATTPYSIVQLPADEAITASSVSMPPYPVMIVGPTNGYAHVESVGSPYAFALQDGQDYETLFQNVYLELLPSSTLQTGFWCGGNVPGVAGYPAASATFRNVYLRATGSAAQGMGWYFRKWHESPAVLDHCLVNAAGSSNFIGISAVDAPRLEMRNCTFVNFPKMDADGYGVAIQIEQTAYASGSPTTTVANCVFDNSFTNAYPLGRLGYGYVVNAENTAMPRDFIGSHRPDACAGIVYASNCVAWTGHAISGSIVDEMGIGALAPIGNGSSLDSDNDGLTDWEEVYQYGTDPFKADSDGDGFTDAIEIADGSDPRDARDYFFQIQIEWPVRLLTNCVVCANLEGSGFAPVELAIGTNSVRLPVFHATNVEKPRLLVFNSECTLTLPYSLTNAISTVAVQDSDHDGMNDAWELSAGLCPTNAADSRMDPDNDGMLNVLECNLSFNPFEQETNTLASLIARSVDERISGKTPALPMPRFVDYHENGTTNTFVDNDGFWLSDVDLSALCMWNDGAEHSRQAITLISPRHVIFAQHYSSSMPLSRKYYFKGKSGVVYERSLIRKDALLNDADGNDIAIGLLNAELPSEDVVPLCVLPEDFQDYVGSAEGLPVVFVDQEECGHIGTCNAIDLVQRLDFSFSNVAINGRDGYYKGAVKGDSSSPKLFVAGNIPILLGVTRAAGGAGGRFVSQYITEVNNLMHDQLQEPLYSLTMFDCRNLITGGCE